MLFKFRFFFVIFFHRDGNIQIGDEIVYVSGRCLRGLSIQQVQELLGDSTKGTSNCIIDLVICRYVANNKEKSRIKSTDTYLDEAKDSNDVNSEQMFEFAASHIK